MTAANKINAHDLFRDGQIGVVEFFSAKTILDLVVKNSDSAVDDEVVIRPMRESDRDVVTLNNAKGLANQEMLTSAVQPTLDETIKFVDVTWIAFRQMNFKYCLVAEKNGEVVGQYFVQDHHSDVLDKVIMENIEKVSPKLRQVFGAVISTEQDGVCQLLPDHPKPGSGQASGIALDPVIVTTSPTLGPAENLAVVRAMEIEIIKMAKQHKFKLICTLNTNPVTKQLTAELGYQTLREIKVNSLTDADTGKHLLPDHDDDQIISLDYMFLD